MIWSCRLLTLLAALAATGCFVGDDDDEVPYGSLVVDWTIENSKDPRACRDNGADGIDVIVNTVDGVFVDEVQGNCEDFELSLRLAPDAYIIDAVLLDARGTQLTTAVTDRLRVRAFESSLSAVDFPADSFY